MGNDILDLNGLARYLRRDSREVTRLVDRGQIPGRKVGGEWRFTLAEIDYWLESQIPTFTDNELQAFDGPTLAADEGLIVARLLPLACIGWPLEARTRSSVMRGLVKLAEESWQVYDPEAILEAILSREELASTALENGVAIPHPRRPMSGVLGESVIALGRTAGIAFGAPGGRHTDLFFLVCCTDARTHLQVLARLARLFLRPDFLDGLRDTSSASEALKWIEAEERALIADITAHE